MWLEALDKKIENLFHLVRPEIRGDVIKHVKEIRYKTILKTVSEFKKGVILLKLRYAKNISIPFKEISDEKNLSEYDTIISTYNDEIEQSRECILTIVRIEIQEEVKHLLVNIIEETIIETTFEFQKGVNSLEAHIAKTIAD